MREVVGYGITGCGYIGAAQARVIDSLDGARLVAVHSATGAGAERVSAALGCDVAASIELSRATMRKIKRVPTWTRSSWRRRTTLTASP